MPAYFTRTLKLGNSPELENLATIAGKLYSLVVVRFWRVVRKQGLWLQSKDLMRWCKTKEMYAQSAQAIVEQFYDNVRSWRQRRKLFPEARPPHKAKKFFKVTWKGQCLQLRNGKLRLPNGKATPPLFVGWRWELPKYVEMGWDGDQYELRAVYAKQCEIPRNDGGVAGVDLGEVHTAAVFDGDRAFVFNGRFLRSIRRYQCKLSALLSSRIDKMDTKSKRRQRAQASRRWQLRKINNQIRDVLHKQTTRLISMLHERGIRTVVIGDVRTIRKGLNLGRKTNQKIGHWAFGKVRRMLTYKAERLGMTVVLQDESYTSQTCPKCEHRHKSSGRRYRCPACGFEWHRDVVGAANIRSKYLGLGPVVGATASPVGVRYSSHMRCSSGGVARAVS